MSPSIQESFSWYSEIPEEESRAFSEELDEETLAIFDLLRKPSLSKKEREEVKKVAIKTLATLKEEKLKIDRWRESTQVTAQVRIIIYDNLQWLPQEAYLVEEINDKANLVYQHVYSNYSGGDRSVYAQ